MAIALGSKPLPALLRFASADNLGAWYRYCRGKRTRLRFTSISAIKIVRAAASNKELLELACLGYMSEPGEPPEHLNTKDKVLSILKEAVYHGNHASREHVLMWAERGARAQT